VTDRPDVDRRALAAAGSAWAALVAARRRAAAAQRAAASAAVTAAIEVRLAAGMSFPWEISDELAERHEPYWAPDTPEQAAPALHAHGWAVQMWCDVLEWSHEQRREIDSWRHETEAPCDY